MFIFSQQGANTANILRALYNEALETAQKCLGPEADICREAEGVNPLWVVTVPGAFSSRNGEQLPPMIIYKAEHLTDIIRFFRSPVESGVDWLPNVPNIPTPEELRDDLELGEEESIDEK